MAVKRATSAVRKAAAPKKVAPAEAASNEAVSARAASTRAASTKAATGPSAPPQRLRVLENEKPWTVRELAAVRTELDADIARLEREISLAEVDLAGLMRDAGEGAGDDQADAGTATFEREQEISLANNAREVFEQSIRALARLVDGSYGICESCGSPIGKNRLLAFPRATLCLTCKSKQERR
jgi:RNA polymerase-binding transcription factor DksA